MRQISTISKIFLLLAVFILPYNTASANGSGSDFFIDLLILQDGKTLSDAESYFKTVVPIASKHGLVRIHSFTVKKTMSGETKPQLVNLWTMSGNNVFEGIGSDPEYRKMIPIRNKLFDMKRSTMLMLDQPL